MDLLDDESLERSAVVANCRTNRERALVGSNGYDKELGLDPMFFLKVANLALENVRLAHDPNPGRKLVARLRRPGLEFDGKGGSFAGAGGSRNGPSAT